MARALRCLLGFLLGAILGFALAAAVSLTIRAFFPAENMAYGLAGVLTAFIAVPVLGAILAIKFGRRKPPAGDSRVPSSRVP